MLLSTGQRYALFGSCITFIALEFVVFSFWTCAWPDAGNPKEYTRVAVLSDAQLTDESSYGWGPGLKATLAGFYSDVYMKKCFRRVRALKPDAVLMMGDMFDGGRQVTDEVYAEELARFSHVFAQRPEERVPMYNATGNHDVGMGHFNTTDALYARYEAAFGPANYRVPLGNFTLVVVDTVALGTVGRREDAPWTAAARKFVEEERARAENDAGPRVLVSHIPLARAADASCGSLRTSPPITNQVGPSYQNLVDGDTSAWLLGALQPLLVLSGDDHDVCEHVHASARQRVPELTVGTFSWLQGNRSPSFALLALRADHQGPVVMYNVCYLPSYISILGVYGWMAVAALGATCACRDVERRVSVPARSPEDGECPAEAGGGARGRAGLTFRTAVVPASPTSTPSGTPPSPSSSNGAGREHTPAAFHTRVEARTPHFVDFCVILPLIVLPHVIIVLWDYVRPP